MKDIREVKGNDSASQDSSDENNKSETDEKDEKDKKNETGEKDETDEKDDEPKLSRKLTSYRLLKDRVEIQSSVQKQYDEVMR